MRILVIGESCKDIFCYGTSNRMDPAAPVPVLNTISYEENVGMAKNVQYNIEALGHECDIITNDNWRQITKTRYVHKNTNYIFLRVDENDNRCIQYDISTIDLSKYDIVVISDYNKGLLTKEDIYNISINHKCVFLDTKKKLGSWCSGIKYIKINNDEYEKSKNMVTEEIEKILIVTLGERGCRFQDTIYSVDRVEIKDLAGAGDTFLAGLVVEYSRTRSIERAIVFANECATKVVQKRGVSVV